MGHRLGCRVHGIEAGLDGLVEAGLVGLHDQDVVGPLPHDLLGDLSLAAHGVQGDDAALQIQDLQQFWDGGDLVALAIHGPLAQHQPVGRGEGAHQVQGGLSLGHGGAKRLALQGDNVARDFLPDLPNPGQEALPKGLGVEQLEHPVDGVGIRYAVRQLQKGPQPVILELGEPVDVLPTFRAAQGGQDGDQDNVEQVVALAPGAARVRKVGQMVCQGTDFGPHGCSLHDSQFPSSGMRYKTS